MNLKGLDRYTFSDNYLWISLLFPFKWIISTWMQEHGALIKVRLIIKMAQKQSQEHIDAAWKWFVTKYEARGYRSLNHFASENGMQKSSLSRYFHLEREIPSGTIGKLCIALKVSPEELLKAVGALGWPAKPKRSRG